MQLNWLCSSSGTMLIGDASLQKPIGFALGVAVKLVCTLVQSGSLKTLAGTVRELWPGETTN